MKQQKQGFTLVELIVVITILAILSTIGFVSYSGYLSGVRDTNRISQLKSMADGLDLYSIKKTLPLPDDYIEIKSGVDVIAYQGYIGELVLEIIDYSSEGLDPKDGTYYSYYLTKDRKNYQLMALLEEDYSITAGNLSFDQANAVDYSSRYIYAEGDKLGMLTDEFNTPIQSLATFSGGIDIADVGAVNLKSVLKYNKIIAGTSTIFSDLKAIAEVGGRGWTASGSTFSYTDIDGVPVITTDVDSILIVAPTQGCPYKIKMYDLSNTRIDVTNLANGNTYTSSITNGGTIWNSSYPLDNAFKILTTETGDGWYTGINEINAGAQINFGSTLSIGRIEVYRRTFYSTHHGCDEVPYILTINGTRTFDVPVFSAMGGALFVNFDL